MREYFSKELETVKKESNENYRTENFNRWN